MEWQKNISRLHIFIPSPGPSLPGMTLPRPFWVRLKRLRTGVRLFRSTMQELGALGKLQMRSRGANGRSHNSSCPLYHPTNGALGLTALDNDTVNGLKRTTLSI